MYVIILKENCKKVVVLLILVIFMVVVVGIIELFEFIFLFIVLFLFVLYVLLVVIMDILMYGFGVVGNMGGGVLDFIVINWILLGKVYWMIYVF